MRIVELQIKSFGKLKDQTIRFDQPFQIIYGENEAGKSTIHTFIRAMLFGLERGRGRASIHDTFRKYEPLEHPNDYAGVLIFECGGKQFRLERNFDKYRKGARLFCLTDGEELSVADGDLDALLSDMTAERYGNTLYVGQLRVTTGVSLMQELQNYATNYYMTGDGEIHLTDAMSYLREERKKLEKREKILQEEENKRRYELEQESGYVWRDLCQIEEELQKIKESVQRMENEEKKEWDRRENKRLIDELRPEKWRLHPVEAIVMISCVIASFLLLPKPWNAMITIILALAFVTYGWNRLKISKKKHKTSSEQLLESLHTETADISKEKLYWNKETLEKSWQEKHTQYENLKEELEEFGEVSEESRQLLRRKQALVLATERIETLSKGVKQQLEAQLNQTASQILEEITEGAYERLVIDDGFHMRLIKDGQMISMEKVSQGTLEQVYFALRMAVAKVLYEEEYPIILDDTFVFYDEKRLAQVLSWLSRQSNQILLFTCQKREEYLMHALDLSYGRIEL